MGDDLISEYARATGEYPAIVPYLMVRNGMVVIAFLEQGFGGKRRFVMSNADNGVQHAEVDIGTGLIMLSDAGATNPTPVHLCLYVAEVDKVYESALRAGAVSISQPEKKDYGQRVAGVTDPAGNTWWICAAAQ